MKSDVKRFFLKYEELGRKNADKIKGMNASVVYDFSKDNHGIWNIVIKDGIISPLTEGDIKSPDLKIITSFTTFYGLRTGTIDGQSAIINGDICVEGDISVTKKLGEAGIG